MYKKNKTDKITSATKTEMYNSSLLHTSINGILNSNGIVIQCRL